MKIVQGRTDTNIEAGLTEDQKVGCENTKRNERLRCRNGEEGSHDYLIKSGSGKSPWESGKWRLAERGFMMRALELAGLCSTNDPCCAPSHDCEDHEHQPVHIIPIRYRREMAANHNKHYRNSHECVVLGT